jgi:hypothetical protein
VTLYRIPTPCQTCEYTQCRCTQDAPVPTTITCARCYAVSDDYDSEADAIEELTQLGWSVGREDYANLCEACISGLSPRTVRGWATA